MIFGPRLTSFEGAWSGPLLVQDIWSVFLSVEEVDALTEFQGGRQPCGYIDGR